MIAPSADTAADTRRRAELRGREAVALWRIKGAVWGARLYAALFAVVSIIPLLRTSYPDWTAASILAAIAIGLLIASEFLRRGSRVAALLLMATLIAAKLMSWLYAHEPLWSGAVWTIIVFGAFANGIWGAFELAAVKRARA